MLLTLLYWNFPYRGFHNHVLPTKQLSIYQRTLAILHTTIAIKFRKKNQCGSGQSLKKTVICRVSFQGLSLDTCLCVSMFRGPNEWTQELCWYSAAPATQCCLLQINTCTAEAFKQIGVCHFKKTQALPQSHTVGLHLKISQTAFLFCLINGSRRCTTIVINLYPIWLWFAVGFCIVLECV